MSEPISPTPRGLIPVGAPGQLPADSLLPPSARPTDAAFDRGNVLSTRAITVPSDAAVRTNSTRGSSAALAQVIDEEPVSWAETLQSAPPWLASLVLHMLVLIVLGLMVVTLKEATLVTMEAVRRDEPANQIGDQLKEDNTGLPTADKFDPNVLTTEYSPINLPPVEHPLALPQRAMGELSPLGRFAASDNVLDAPIGFALRGRDKGHKIGLLQKYGGTRLTETAVQRSLEWLKRNQRSSGYWMLNGPYADAGEAENKTAATAMALLAFQGAGNTHKFNADSKYDYKQVVKKGVDALVKLQNSDGLFTEAGIPHYHQLYSHAQATIAICELYGMTKDSTYRGAAERAVRYCVKNQSSEGGWRYTPGIESDTSVTGWFAMALQSALMAGLEVPSSTLQNISKFLDSVQTQDGSRYSYMPNRPPNSAMVAEGLLCRQYLGWKRDDVRLISGVEYLATEPINNGDVNAYYWYYATQVMHHMGGRHWDRWNAVMRQVLPDTQVKKGPEEGSWDPAGDTYGQGRGGRLFSTCLRTYMLQVYYRHLPIYAELYNPVAADDSAKQE